MVARLPRPASGKLSVALGDGQRLDAIELPDAPYTLVYVKSVRSGTVPAHAIMPLNRP